MAAAFRDIIDLCNTDPCTWRADTTDKDWMELLARIGDIAHRGLYGEHYDDK